MPGPAAALARRLGGAACALALAGCAALVDPVQTAALLKEPPAGLPARLELTRVPFFPQTPYHCGPAALATVLAEAGDTTVDPQRLAESVFLPARAGSLQAEMLAAARSRGRVATRLPPELSALLRELAAGHAVVVLQNLSLPVAPVWHYAVLVGYDLGTREVILRSGTTERARLPLATFEHTWARSGHWAIVVLPPGRLPASASLADAFDAALGFERVARPDDAALAYRALLGRWPDHWPAAIGLSNALDAGGHPAAARQALEDAAQRQDRAPVWNNLARLRLATGDRDAALDAARRAVQRAESAEQAWLPAARQTLEFVATGGR